MCPYGTLLFLDFFIPLFLFLIKFGTTNCVKLRVRGNSTRTHVMRNTYRIENDEIIIGRSLPVFIDNLNYHLTEIHIYKDGKIDCWELTDINGFIKKVKSGWIKTTIPKKHDLYAFPLGNFKVEEFYPRFSEDELIKEVKDVIKSLNDKPTSGELCYEAFHAFQKAPTNENLAFLKELYESIPNHNKQFVLGDMDVDDIPIRVVLYGESEYEKSDKGKIQMQYIKDTYLKGL